MIVLLLLLVYLMKLKALVYVYKSMLYKIIFKCNANLGPLTTKSGDNYYQTGVVSWGFGCAQVRKNISINSN